MLDGTAFQLPDQIVNAVAGSYFSAVIHWQDDVRKSVIVDIRKTENSLEVVGVERTW